MLFVNAKFQIKSKMQVLKKKNDAIQDIATRNGKTRAQVVLNFLTTEESVITIPKADNPDHVSENCGASGWRLSKDDQTLQLRGGPLWKLKSP